MSTQNTSHDPGGHGVQKEDRIDFKKVVAVGVVSLVIFALATWWSISILHTERAALTNRGEGRLTAELGRPEIGIVDQVPFDGDTRLEIWKKGRAQWLGEYGWIDRAHGVVHIPIDRAIDALVGGSVPPPPPSSGVSPPAPAPAPAREHDGDHR